ncbi:unnamed protein product [Dicrocoelium dendriticum]|nr:unnamed protein product [Dicrocoelium dendriticum]
MLWPSQSIINGALSAASSRLDRDLEAAAQAFPSSYSPLWPRSDHFYPPFSIPQLLTLPYLALIGFYLLISTHMRTQSVTPLLSTNPCPTKRSTPVHRLPCGALDLPSD